MKVTDSYMNTGTIAHRIKLWINLDWEVIVFRQTRLGNNIRFFKVEINAGAKKKKETRD